MKPIAIRVRLCPFSHTPGLRCLIPSTTHVIQCFPALIRVAGQELPLEVDGAVEQFTVVQDLERRCVTLFSRSYHVHILPTLEVVSTKHPQTLPVEQPRYCFGTHRKQQWERIRAQCDLTVLFPIWMRLGGLLQLPQVEIDDRGVFGLLGECTSALANHRPEHIFPAFRKLFLAGFHELMLPRSEDTDYQGILPLNTPVSTTPPLYLLTEGAALIRSLFLEQMNEELVLLPNLPPELFAGRIVGERWQLGTFDCIWSKKRLLGVILHAEREGELSLRLPHIYTRYRVTASKQRRWIPCGTRLAIEKGERYLLDCFE